jgi:hypothetical protein
MNLAKEMAVPRAATFMAITCQGSRFFIVSTLAPKPDSRGKPEMEKLAIANATQIGVGMAIFRSSLKLRLGRLPAQIKRADFTNPWVKA